MLNTSAMTLLSDRTVGGLAVSPARRRLEGPGGAVTLEPLVMRLLLLLADAEGKVIARRSLFDELWGSAPVGDDSLNRLVASLRRAFERAGGKLQVETVPRTGYRLIDEAQTVIDNQLTLGDLGSSRRVWIAGTAGLGIIAVTGASFLWSERAKERQAQSLYQQAQRIVSVGIPWELERAQKLLEGALRLDPNNGPALGLLSSLQALAIGTLPPAERPAALEKAYGLIAHALSVAPGNADALLARLEFDQSTLSWAQYEERLQAIQRGAPRNTAVLDDLTYFTQAAGQTRRSWAYNELAIALNPSSPQPQWRKALKYWILGRTADADRVIDHVRTLWPEHPFAWNARFLIYAFTGRPEAAAAMIDDPLHRPRTVTAASMAQWGPTLIAIGQPTGERLASAVAANIACAQNSPGQAAYAAMALSALGQVDAAYKVAEGFLIARGPLLTREVFRPNHLLVNDPGWRQTQWLFAPPMKQFRADARFTGLWDALSLTDYWRVRGGPDPV